MYEGRAVSPRQMTVAVAGPGHNAWRDLFVRRPGELWVSASRHRREIEAATLMAQVRTARARADLMQQARMQRDGGKRRGQRQVTVPSILSLHLIHPCTRKDRRIPRWRCATDILAGHMPGKLLEQACWRVRRRL